MSQEARVRQLERNYEMMRAELAQVKRLGQEYKQATENIEVLRVNELHTLQQEVEHLRIENQRLRDQVERYTSKPTPREPFRAVNDEPGPGAS